jgi:hypothetical protein
MSKHMALAAWHNKVDFDDDTTGNRFPIYSQHDGTLKT